MKPVTIHYVDKIKPSGKLSFSLPQSRGISGKMFFVQSKEDKWFKFLGVTFQNGNNKPVDEDTQVN